jgi:hypothetical protein
MLKPVANPDSYIATITKPGGWRGAYEAQKARADRLEAENAELKRQLAARP